MDPIARRRLGRTSLEVTQLGFGAAPIGGFRATIPEAQASAAVAAAYDGGVNFFDTSPYYGYGRSELRVGAVLREKPRGSYVLSTKVGRWMRPLRDGETAEGFRPTGLRFAPTFDYGYDGVMRSVEQSHLRLGIPTIDILLPYNSGILAGTPEPGAKYDYADAPDRILDRARRIDAVCRRHDVPLAAAALQFPLGHRAVCSVIPGAFHEREVVQNIAHLRRPIPADLWRELKREGLLDEGAPVPGDPRGSPAP